MLKVYILNVFSKFLKIFGSSFYTKQIWNHSIKNYTIPWHVFDVNVLSVLDFHDFVVILKYAAWYVLYGLTNVNLLFCTSCEVLQYYLCLTYSVNIITFENTV